MLPEKSTTDRFISAGLHAVQAGSPELAARIGERLMFRTPRLPLPIDEADLLDAGARVDLETRAGTVATWSWGEGPVVVLMHGWRGRTSQLGGFVAPLVDAGFRVVGFDAPGPGASPGTRSNIVRFAAALADVVDTVQPVLGPAHAVIAHSMGAPATLIAMQRALARDGTLPVQRFVFVAPPIDFRLFVRAFSEHVELGRQSALALGRIVEEKLSVRFDELYAPDLARHMQAPLLVLHDEGDREVPIAAGHALVAAWPGATLYATHGLGHVRILRDADVVRRAVRFLAT
jgi:pimeloyl-ACP methyl ester carboxylesterase